MTTLPVLGLGLSSNAQTADFPRPYALLDAQPGLYDYVEYSAPLDIDVARAEATLFPEMEKRRADVPLVYHPVHINLWGPELEDAERLAACAAHVEAVGSPWVSNDVGWWHHRGQALPGYLYLSPPLSAEGVEQCVAHAVHVKNAMPVPMLLENPTVMTARGALHVLDFMEKLSTASACDVLLDVGHLFSHQLARGLSLTEGLDSFPWERVRQLHIAGGVVKGQTYLDDHPQPIRDEVWALFADVLKRCSRLCAVTYEGDGHPDVVAVANLKKLRGLHLPSPRALAEGQARAPELPSTALTATGVWALLDQTLREPSPELDFRLTVLAEALDREVPISRRAVAPSADQLRHYPLREWLEHGARPLADHFLAWAMKESRRPELAGADALVSLELWARTTHARAQRATPGPVDATFPMNLTEALHAFHALSRHDAGWDGLLQCARRATPGPWRLRLSARGASVHIDPLA
ncbi:MAG: hypothetical protein DI536_08780 [Archangium gephyra]|uniref:DUF692 family protein n=1 Tax=Archangium gephyra TaxID=48 RepID=A0A2W5TQ94_9BACT|nr:MAG: hypothetical protein DI536_08780 [Archangium gephyra]